MRRLGTDWNDLYQLHLGDASAEAATLIVAELEALWREGKIRYYGWSTDLLERRQLWRGRAGFAALQFEINILRERDDMLALLQAGAGSLAGLCRGPPDDGAAVGQIRPAEPPAAG